MVNNRKISIVVPVFNEKDTIMVFLKFLKTFLNYKYEVLIVYDDENDSSLHLKKKIKQKNIKFIKNNYGKGVSNAVLTGVENSKFKIIAVTTVDEIIPILSFDKMYQLLVEKDYHLVSATRYSLEGRRYGGKFIGSLLSFLANKFFKILTNFPISDLTTGIKIFKKTSFLKIKKFKFNSGWVFAFELSIKFYLKKMRIGEVPIISVDRLYGGSSSFILLAWLKEYLKCFLWGLAKIYCLKIKY